MSYSIAEADLEREEGAIVDFWSKNLGTGSGRFHWLNRNPAGRLACLLLRTPQGEILGSAGLAPRSMRTGGGMLRCAQAADLAVDRRHRTGAAAIRLERAVIEAVHRNGFAFAYTFPSPNSEKVMLRAGFSPLGEIERWTRPLRSDHTLSRWIPSLPARRVAATFVDAAIALTLIDLSLSGRRYRWEIRDTFDGRFDELWAAASAQFHVVGERSQAFLAWRFMHAPHAGYRIFCLSRAERLLGYIVFQQRKDRALVVDFLFRDAGCIAPLFRAFAARMYRAGTAAVVVNFFGPARIGEALRAAGFYRRPDGGRVLVYWPRGDAAALQDGAWYMTQADRDV